MHSVTYCVDDAVSINSDPLVSYVVKVLHGDVNITLGSAARFAEALKLDFFLDLRDENGDLYTGAEPKSNVV